MEKKCQNCGQPIDPNARFCRYCGHENVVEEKKIQYCFKCGKPYTGNVTFCSGCGTRLNNYQNNNGENILKKGLDNFTSTINSMTGEQGKVEIKLKELFSEVFKKHSIEEREEMFITGTKYTTPRESQMVSSWPKPWLYSRVFIMFLIVFLALFVMVNNFYNANAIPGAIFIGALMVPFSALIFFWEVNVPRNISIFDVITMFFVGGALSLICTLILYEIISVEQLDYLGAILVGIVEEVGKIAVVIFYVSRKNTKYILNGMLIGACVGAGFAVFETAGYAFNAFVGSGGQTSVMLDILWLRSILSFGCHITWTAIAGVGLIVAKKEEQLNSNHILNGQFLKFLLLAIVLHAIWDMPITFGSEIYLVQWILTFIAIVTVLVLLNAGLRQVSQYAKLAREKELQEMKNQ